MKSEVGHAYVIGVWIDQGNLDPSFPGLPDCPLFLCKEAGYFVEEFFGHGGTILEINGMIIP